MSAPDEFNEIESMLGDLPVREPSQVLDARVASTLDKQTRSALPWLAIAAAVLLISALTLAILFNPAPPSPDANPPVAHDSTAPPVEPTPDTAPPILMASNPAQALDLTWSRDVVEETRYTPAGEPYRAVIREAVDHQAWTNPATGESGHLCLPREEIIVVKQSPF